MSHEVWPGVFLPEVMLKAVRTRDEWQRDHSECELQDFEVSEEEGPRYNRVRGIRCVTHGAVWISEIEEAAPAPTEEQIQFLLNHAQNHRVARIIRFPRPQ